MFASIRKHLQKLVEWLDFPPPRPVPGVADIHWEFMGDLLGELTALSDTETVAFLHRDFTGPDAIRELTRQWIWPVWARFTPASREKILHTLDYCLATGSEKTGWIFPSYGIPIRTETRLFFATVRKELTGNPVPDSIDRRRYRENRRQAFANTLFSDMTAEKNGDTSLPGLPLRHGLILPRDMQRHAASQPLERIRHWAATGTTPDGVPGLPCDAARWTSGTDPDIIREMAAARFERQKHDRVGVHRLTLTFSHPVGEGYLAGCPDTTVTTRKARCIIDRLGFLVRCYPVLRE
ncbi:hypothetical protein NB636_05625 [Oxalobacter aliiformigenes]|uniref:hypothetical protein n=1 Tax=Oxalobacter aliiformigenes TaxID=2946593 RepID=UPI0022AF3462|nr:hypothetical protein [Oxalobacter aliiformigenes]MCZ4065974.1 hypothetical protein [Oxalobacter aliiformigenes]WAW00326.1 hypothetical protein NB636_05625 [Oxalobacter aliiformigenes]